MTSLDGEQHDVLLGSWAGARPVGLLFVSSERGLCGAFNERLVTQGRQHARTLAAQGQTVTFLCLGSRGRRLLEAAGHAILYSRSMPSLAHKLLDRLTLEHNLALSHAATSALLEIIAGDEATAKRGLR